MHFKKIYVEITNICNKNCSFCSNDTKKKQEMTIPQFEHILKEIKPYTNYLYLHVKGEPLLHSHLKEILNLCTKYDMQVNVTTNGTLLSKQQEILLTSPCIRQINISLHSFDSEIQYIENILSFTERALKETSMYINYRFWALQNGTLTPKNKALLRQIESFYHVDLSEIMDQKRQLTIKNRLFLSKGDLFDWPSLNLPYVGKVGYCLGLKNHVGILVDGTVIPCCLDSSGKNDLGNIFQDSFSSIITSQKAESIRKGFEDNKMIAPLCQHCSYRNIFKRE